MAGSRGMRPGQDKMRIQVLPPDHWMMQPYQLGRDERFQKSGVVLIAQPPADKDGKAKVNAFYSYTGVTPLIASLRNIDPNYDTNKQPASGGAIDLSQVPTSAWVLLAAAAILLYMLMQKPQAA